MRGFRGGIVMMGAAARAILAGVLSFPHVGLPNHFIDGSPPPMVPKRRGPGPMKRRNGNVHRGWRPHYFSVNTWAGSREAKRRQRQIARGQLRVENGLVL